MKTRSAQVIIKAPVHRNICIFGPSKPLTVEKDSAFTKEVIQFILRAINCPLKIISLFDHGKLKTQDRYGAIEKMIKNM